MNIKEMDILKGALNNIPVGVIVADLNGNFLLFNKAAEKILGMGTGKLDPADWSKIYGCYYPDKVTPFPSEQLPLYRALSGQKVDNEKIYIKNPERSNGVWISVSGQPLKNDEGTIWGGMVTVRDITSRQKDREEIKNYERLCSALQQTADSVIITDRRGIIEYVNAAFVETTGYGIDEAIGRNPKFLKSGNHDEKFYSNLWGEILAGRPFRGTILNKKKSGELFWAQQTITPLKEDNGNITHFVSLLKDITDLIARKDKEAKLQVAREIQQRFYGINITVPGYDTAGQAGPVEETGGDYFDFIQLSNGNLCFAVGDVCGHGLGAALLMTETRAYLRSTVENGFDIAESLAEINKHLIPDLETGEFVTLMICCLDPKKRTLTYASAGHVPGFLIEPNGEVKAAMGGTGPPLGLFPDQKYSSEVVSFSRPGQILLMPTDGIMDAVSSDGCPFGIEQTIKYVGTHREEPAREIIRGLFSAVKNHAKNLPQLDDITAIVVKAL